MAMLKNKKGLSYFYLIGIIFFLLITQFFFLVSAPAAEAEETIDFKTTISAVDLINAKIPAETFYKKEETRLAIENAKKSFSQTLGLTQSELIDRAKGDQSDLLGCKIGSKQLWYNEKNVDYNNLNSELENVIDEIEDNVNEDSVESEQDEDTKQDNDKSFELDNCLPSFDSNFKGKFTSFVEDRLDEGISTGLKTQDTASSPVVELTYNEETDEVETQIDTYYEEASDIARISLDLEYRVSQDIGQYPDLLFSLSKIIPKLPNAIKEEVAPCMKVGDISELECIEKSFVDQVQEVNSNLLKEYEFEIKFMDEVKSSEYYGLEINVIKKASHLSELNFGIILKDNIPYSLINFELKAFTGLDNVVEIVIDEPRFTNDVSSYIVIYSYDNFFSSSYDGYQELHTLLNNNQIPTNFEKTGYTDPYENQYFYSGSSKMDVSLMTTSNTDFTEDSITGKRTKSIKIYQIYDRETKKYKLLENKPLYVYAFATDDNLNYYVQEILNKAKVVVPETFLGPFPIPLNEKNSIAAAKEGNQNTIFFKVADYNDARFDHFDLYIIEKGGGMIPFCEAAASTCHYFDGSSVLTSTEDVAFVVSSETRSEKDENLFAFIEASKFSNGLVIENGKKYDVYLVPMDKARKGIMTTQKTEWQMTLNTAKDISYYALSKGKDSALQTPTKVSGLTVVDMKAPDLYNSIYINGITLSNGYLNLDWNSVVTGDVTSLKGDLTITYTNSEPKTHTNYNVGIDGRIVAWASNMATVTYSRILPMDASNNPHSTVATSENTHRVSYP